MHSGNKDGLILTLLGSSGTRLGLHSIRVIGQFGWAGGDRAIQKESLEIVEQGRVFLGEKRDGNSGLAGTTCSSNPVCVVLDALGHVIVDHHGDIPGEGGGGSTHRGLGQQTRQDDVFRLTKLYSSCR